MAFDAEPTRTPTSIGNIIITLKDAVSPPSASPYQAAYFDIQIVFSDGTYITRTGDLVPHITPAQRQGLIDFMDSLRTQAESEVLP